MNIAQELSIVRDNIAEYGMTNITQLEYDAIYQQGRAEAEEDAENRMSRILDDEKRLSYEQGRADRLDSIIKAVKNEYHCVEDLCGESKNCSDCMVRYLEQLKKGQK